MNKSMFLVVILFFSCGSPAENVSPPPVQPPTTLEVTFDSNGGTGIQAPLSWYEGTSDYIPDTTITNSGKILIGWNTKNDGTGMWYAEGGRFLMPAQSMKLYAIWGEGTGFVYFHPNGGIGAVVSQAIATGESANLMDVSFSRSGYNFYKLNTQSDGNGTNYAKTDNFTMGSTSVVLYAVWNRLMGGGLQMGGMNFSGNVSTLAGYGPIPNAGQATTVRLQSPGMACFLNNCIYFLENYSLAKVDLTSGVLTRIAGRNGVSGIVDEIGSAARFGQGSVLTTNGTDLFVAGTSTIRKVNLATNAITTLAGSVYDQGCQDGTGYNARMTPISLAADNTYVYFSDSYNCVRRLTISTGLVVTIAGSSNTSGYVDGTGTASRFSSPRGIVLKGSRLFVSDLGNNRIREINTSTYDVTTLAGGAEAPTPNTDGIGTGAKISYPIQLASVGSNLFTISYGDVRKIDIDTKEVSTPRTGDTSWSLSSDGTSLLASTMNSITRLDPASQSDTILAGGIYVDTSGSSDGVGLAARFKDPTGVTSTMTMSYISDSQNHIIRKLNPLTGEVTTFAGKAGISGSADGIGTDATFNCPAKLTNDGTNIYVIDSGNSVIRQINLSTRLVTTMAGSPGQVDHIDGIGSNVRFDHPSGITTDGVSVYISETDNGTIRKLNPLTKEVTTIAGSYHNNYRADGVGKEARFYKPGALTSDGDNLYIEDDGSVRIMSLSTYRTYGEVFSFSSFYDLEDMATDGHNIYYMKNNVLYKNPIKKNQPSFALAGSSHSGYVDGFGSEVLFGGGVESGISIGGAGLIITDHLNNSIRLLK